MAGVGLCVVGYRGLGDRKVGGVLGQLRIVLGVF